jgi:hypothetical protein
MRGKVSRAALAATSDPASAFPAELQRHGLVAIEAIVEDSAGAIVVELHEEQIIIRSPNAERTRAGSSPITPLSRAVPFHGRAFLSSPGSLARATR